MTQRTPDQSRRAILDYLDRLSAEFVQRREVLEMMAVALAAKEPMLLLGPPGTAKSDMVIKFSRGLGLREHDYFEYMINAFTEPSEILGPVDIRALRDEGEYRRMLEGKIAVAQVVFLDEIFNGNSAILNTLLTIMNERKVYQAGTTLYLDHLVGFFAATNQIPERTELDALKDRFVIKVELGQIHATSFPELVSAGIRADVNSAQNRTPWIVPEAVTLEDFAAIRRFVHRKIHENFDTQTGRVRLPEPVMNKFFYLTQELESKGVEITDREVIKLLKVIVVAGYLLNGHLPDSITDQDLFVLRYLGETHEQFVEVRQCVNDALGIVED
jgi:MoxR-like ATPase